MNVSFCSITEKGKRQNNEDAVINLHLGPGTYFFAVADGMGGVKGGEIASKLVLQTASNYLKDYFSSHFVSAVSLKSILREMYVVSQQAIRDFITDRPDYSGMGTTLTCLLIFGNAAVWGNLGDSRIYNIYNGKIRKVTRDHNYLEEALRNRSVESAAHLSQYRHMLTRALDGSMSEADIYPEKELYQRLEDSSFWLLCSDGIITDEDNSHESYFVRLFKTQKSLKMIGSKAINNALNKGSTDNISLITVKVTHEPSIQSGLTQRIITGNRRRYLNSNIGAWVAPVLVVVFIGGASVFIFRDSIPGEWISEIARIVKSIFHKN